MCNVGVMQGCTLFAQMTQEEKFIHTDPRRFEDWGKPKGSSFSFSCGTVADLMKLGIFRIWTRER